MARRLVACLVVAAFLAVPSVAHAIDDCEVAPINDDDGVQIDFNRFGEVETLNRNGYDASGTVYYDYGFTAGNYYEDIPGTGCTLEDSNREVVWPSVGHGAVAVRAKVFVPPDQPAFVRHLWSFRNTGGAPVDFEVFRYFETEYSPRDVEATSSGDDIGTVSDDWVVFDNNADGGDPAVAIVWQGSDAVPAVSAAHVYQTCCDNPGQFDPVVANGPKDDVNTDDLLHLAPGETQILMHLHITRLTPAAAAAAAEQLAAGPAAVFAGMTQEEIGAVHNFGGTDVDADGVETVIDNCRSVANPDQANNDDDADGDACDDDDDNDGLSDEAELAFGTDPKGSDTDGDGRPDRDDACPTTVGAGADGCPAIPLPLQPGPAPPAITQILGRVDPRSTTATLTPARDRRLPFVFTARGSVLPPDGLSAQQACSSPGFVNVVVRRGRKVVARRRAQLLPDCTFVVQMRFRNRRRVGRGRRTLTFTVSWLGNRFLEPAAIQTFTRRVG